MSWNRGLRGQDYLNPRPCPTCKQMMSAEFLKKRNLQRGKNIKEALKNAEFKGRPRTVDYGEIKKLRSQGYSICEISEKLSTSERTVSRGAVQHCLRLAKIKGGSDE